MLRYPVTLKRDTNGTILATFPDVPEAHTFGDDEPEALMRAVDALETALSLYVDDRRDLPKPSCIPARGKAVTLPALSEAKLALYEAMRASRVSKAELARRLNCHLPQVDRRLDLMHHSRLDQLEAAFGVLGKVLSNEIREAGVGLDRQQTRAWSVVLFFRNILLTRIQTGAGARVFKSSEQVVFDQCPESLRAVVRSVRLITIPLLAIRKIADSL